MIEGNIMRPEMVSCAPQPLPFVCAYLLFELHSYAHHAMLERRSSFIILAV